MKVLIVIDSLGGGGAERSTQVLCDYLAENKVKFKIVCLYFYPNGFHQEMIEKGYDIQFLQKKGFLGQTKEVAKIISNENFDIVHSILFKSNLRVRFSKLKTKFVHLESIVNSTYSDERRKDEKVNQTLLKVYKVLDRYSATLFVDHFHAITNSVKEHYIKHLGLDSKKISIVYRGRKSVLLNREKPSGTHKFTLLNVARQDYQKGQIYLLQAMKVLKAKGVDIKLIILGVEGSETPRLKKYHQENELGDMVEFAGFSNDVNFYYSLADVFIFSSLFEGLGGALIEAQSAGLPIISNDIEVLREVVQPNINGLFVDIKNTQEVSDAILKLKTDVDLRQRFSEESLKNYTNKYREEISNLKMLNLYKSLC
jgi:glycosyltransferase involved in cell wall biosynthesis